MDASPSLGDFWKILLLRPATIESVGQSKTGVWLSLRLFFLAGLIGSIGVLAGGLAEAGQATFADRLSAAASSLTAAASGWPQQWTPRLAAAAEATAGRLQAASDAIVAVQPPLGSGPSQALRAVGAWVSQPLLALTTWMTMMLPILLVARLLGGRGSLRRQVSLMLLAFLPQALVFLSSFQLEPGGTATTLATVLRGIAVVWSLVILLVTLAAANGFERAQAAKVLLVTVVAVAAIAGLVGLLAERLAGPLLSLLL